MSIRFDVKQMNDTPQSPWFFDDQTTLKFGVLQRKSINGHPVEERVQWFDTEKQGLSGTQSMLGKSETTPRNRAGAVCPGFESYPQTFQFTFLKNLTLPYRCGGLTSPQADQRTTTLLDRL